MSSAVDTPLSQLEITELIERIQQDNSRAAMEQLVKRVQKNVYVALYQLLPERGDMSDLTQEVLLRMCRSIHSLRNPKTFKVWLNRIITNLFYDELRKTSKKPRMVSIDAPLRSDEEESSPREVPDNTTRPDTLTLGSELDQRIRDAIANLPEQFRTIIVLREHQGLSYEEIASLTNTQLGTVKSRLARARLKLQQELQPYLNDV